MLFWLEIFEMLFLVLAGVNPMVSLVRSFDELDVSCLTWVVNLLFILYY